ncbi:MucBP domain-containing protein [Furfurilactobacillus sp. WILCCON 0119]
MDHFQGVPLDDVMQMLHDNEFPSGSSTDFDAIENWSTVLIPNDETVTVNYVSSDGKKLDSKTIDTKFSRTITIDQPSFDGYTIAANQPSSYKVDKDGAGANVVTITYDPDASSSSESSSSSSSSSSSESSSSSSSSSSSNASSSSSSNSSNVASSSVSESSSSSSSVTSNGQSSAANQSNSQSSNDQSIVATLVKEDSSSNNSSNTPTQQTNNRDTSHHASLPSTSAIGYTTSIIGIIILAGVTTLFVIKKRNH